MSKIAIIGSGALGKQIAHFIGSDDTMELVGWFDDHASEGDSVCDAPIIGAISDLDSNKELFDQVLIGIGYHHLEFKDSLIDELNRLDIEIATYIHPTAIVDPSAIIDEGVIVYPGTIIDQNVRINSGVLLNLGVIISHDSVIERSSFIAPGSVISGNTKIGARCFLGAASTIRDGITISDDIRIGAGSTVVSSLNENGTYIGVPAKKV